MTATSTETAGQLAANFLQEARAGRGKPEARRLRALNRSDLARELADDAHSLAFWLNVYNGFVQLILRSRPEAYQKRWSFFAKRQIVIAGHRLSFNAIEHGLLRRSMFGYSLGYLSNPLAGSFERQFRVRQRDPRVHFALNCGARSCPPIAAYSAENIEMELRLATASYLQAESEYEASSNTVTVPRLLLWFRGDFGGKLGVRKLLVEAGVVPAATPPFQIVYKPYDWTLSPEE